MTIREKMARAICIANMEPFAPLEWELYLPETDSALSVLTNPDDETLDILARAVCKTGAYGDYDSAASLYRDLAMSVLEALKEEV